MKELLIKYWCDNQAAKHPPRTVEGDTVLVYDIKKAEVREVDVCEPCLTGMTVPQMQDLVNTFGREQTSVETDPALCCPLPDCDRSNKPFKNPAGRARHLTRVHPEYQAV
jgi:hypothetical protein